MPLAIVPVARAAALLPAFDVALLWALADTRLTHRRQDTALQVGDLALVDVRSAIEIDGEALLMGIEGNAIGLPQRQVEPLFGLAIDGATPLAEATKRLWTWGESLSRCGDADDAVDRHLGRLLGGLVRRLVVQRAERRVSGHAAAMIERADLLISRNLRDPEFGVEQLAAEMRVSARRLSTLFASIGTTTSQAIVAARIDHAKTLLADPSAHAQQIAAIGFACGYSDQGHFTRSFRKITGMTPRDFRRNNAGLG